jgi:hypothetical protein
MYAEWKKARVNLDYHIELGGHSYSTPYQLVGKEVDARSTRGTVEIFHQGKRVASHVRSGKAHVATTNGAHRPKSHREYLEWTPSAPIYQTSPFSPSLAYFGNALYVAFITNDEDSATGVPSNRIFLCSTTDGVSWSEAIFFNQHSKCAPSLAVWNGSLHIAFVANNPTDTLLVYHSSTPDDPTSWSATVATSQYSANAPSLAAYPSSGPNSKLYMAFVAKNGSEDIFVCSVASGGEWTLGPSTGQTCHFSPSLAAGDNLYLVFAAQNESRDLYLCSLNSDGSWGGAVPMNQSTSATPRAAALGSGLEHTGEMLYKTDRRHGLHHGGEQLAFPALA